MKTCVLTLSCLFSLAISTAFAAPHLSTSQRSALIEAGQEGQYPVSIVEKEMGGTLRSVILIGETHRVTAKRHELGLKLVNEFNLIGIEGVNMDSGKVSQPAQDSDIPQQSYARFTQLA